MLRITNLLFFLLIVNLNGVAQGEPPPPSSEDYGCAKKYNYSLSDCLKHYPFNVSKKIIIISFDSLRPEKLEPHMIPEERVLRIPVKDNELEMDLVKESFTLTNEQLNELTTILYNFDYKNDKGIRTMRMCFTPHHALVFFDDANKIIGYVEICFECSSIERSNEKIEMGNFCMDKYDMLKKLFKQIGIKTKIE